MHILAVDDDPVIRDLLGRYLPADQNFKLECHTSASSLLKSAESPSSRFDCILLDIMLPDTDGIEVCRRLRDTKRHSTTPILMITASNDLGLMQRAFDAGATDFLRKPLNAIELRARVISAGMLNKSVTCAYNSQKELARLSRIRFGEALSLNVEGVYDIRALENKILRFQPGCYAMTLVSLEIHEMRGIYKKIKPTRFRECLRHCAQALATVMDCESANVAYVGKGFFICVIQGRRRVNIPDLTKNFNRELALQWDCETTGVPQAPTGTFKQASGQRLWSGLSMSNKLREYVPVSNHPSSQTPRVADNLFTQIAS